MTPTGPRVDSDFLVIPTKTALPQRCMKTNVEISEQEYTTWDVPYLPRWLVIWMLLAWGILLFAPSIVRRRCKFKAGLSRSMRMRYLLRKIIAALLLLVAVLAVPIAILFRSESATLIAIVISLPISWLGCVIFSLGSRPVKIVRYDGNYFWIKGCSKEFLAGLNSNQ